jgi:predicted signal transduction protein with EAL and GGDEF domain
MLKKALHHPEKYSGPYLSIKGLNLWIEAQSFPVYNDNNEVVGGICLIENKTNEHNALQDIKHMASHDPLTSLLNRRGLQEYMIDFMKEDKHKKMYSLLIYLDLNKFKYINDSLGHKAGDKLLIAISDRLQMFLKESCLSVGLVVMSLLLFLLLLLLL